MQMCFVGALCGHAFTSELRNRIPAADPRLHRKISNFARLLASFFCGTVPVQTYEGMHERSKKEAYNVCA